MADLWIHRSEEMKCKTCMWYVGKKALKDQEVDLNADAIIPGVGRCRKRAPSMNGYPVVMLDDWCGDHKLDENRI